MSFIQRASYRLLIVVLLAVVLAACSIARPQLTLPDDAPVELVVSETLLTFDAGTFLEGIAVAADGTLYITAFEPQAAGGAIWRVRPDGAADIFAEVRAGTVAFHPDGSLYATIQSGDFGNPSTFRVSLSRFAADGAETALLTFPAGSGPNGITFDASGNLYAADSRLGRIWRVRPGANEAEVWLEDARLAPQGPQGIPGANGIQVFAGAVYTVNSSSGDFLRIALGEDGAAGAVSVVATGVTGDGFTFAADGTAYITTHPFNTLVKVTPDGAKTIIGNAENGIVGATDAAFGPAEGNSAPLYVVHDGGLFTQLIPPPMLSAFPETSRNDSLPPALVRLDLTQPLGNN